MRIKKQNTKDDGLIKVMVIGIIISIIVITLINVVIAVYPLYMHSIYENNAEDQRENRVKDHESCDKYILQKYYDAASEKSIISSGIAIIGIAIAVWAGLNIIQVLERGEVERLRGEAQRYYEERREFNKLKFLEELRSSNSPACKYFVKIFQKDIKELDATIYFQLSFVEHSYQAVYKDQFATMKRKQGIAFLEDSIAFTKEVLKGIKTKATNENVEEYLYVRIADFYFNLGYVYEFRREYEEMQNCYQNTLENYKCVAKMEHWSKDIVDEIIKRYTKENVNMCFFILNTVAESGSMIISSIINGAPNHGYANQTQELIEMSFNAFTHITDYLSQILKRKDDIEIISREVYFRNFYEFLRRVEQISQHNGGKAVLNLDHQQIVSKELELVQNGMAIIYSGKNEDPPRYKSYKESIDCYLAIIDDENYDMSIDEKLKLLEKAYIYSGDSLRKFSQLPEFRKIRAQICVKLNEVMYQKGLINRQMAYLTEACELIEEYRLLSSCGLNVIAEIKEK